MTAKSDARSGRSLQRKSGLSRNNGEDSSPDPMANNYIDNLDKTPSSGRKVADERKRKASNSRGSQSSQSRGRSTSRRRHKSLRSASPDLPTVESEDEDIKDKQGTDMLASSPSFQKQPATKESNNGTSRSQSEERKGQFYDLHTNEEEVVPRRQVSSDFSSSSPSDRVIVSPIGNVEDMDPLQAFAAIATATGRGSPDILQLSPRAKVGPSGVLHPEVESQAADQENDSKGFKNVPNIGDDHKVDVEGTDVAGMHVQGMDVDEPWESPVESSVLDQEVHVMSEMHEQTREAGSDADAEGEDDVDLVPLGEPGQSAETHARVQTVTRIPDETDIIEVKPNISEGELNVVGKSPSRSPTKRGRGKNAKSYQQFVAQATIGRVSERTLSKIMKDSEAEASIPPPEPAQTAADKTSMQEPIAVLPPAQPMDSPDVNTADPEEPSKSERTVPDDDSSAADRMMYMSDRQLQRFLKDEAKKAKATAAKRTNDTNDAEGADSKRQKTVVTKGKKAPSKKPGDIEADIMDALEDSNVLLRTEPVKPSKGWKKGVGRKHKEGSVVKPESSRDESSMFGGDDGSTFSEEVRERKKGGKKGVRIASPTPSSVNVIISKKAKRAISPVVVEEEDDALYCICKQPYNDTDGREMIQCDGCSNWYHPDCVGLDSKLVPLVGLYICPECEKDPTIVWTTTYREKCLRDECRLPRKEPLSKFCSSLCGVHHMAEVLEKKELDQEMMLEAVKDARQPEAYTTYHVSPLEDKRVECAASALREERAVKFVEMEVLRTRNEVLEQRLRLVATQLAALAEATQKADQLPDIELVEEIMTEEPGKKKGKKGNKAKPGSSADDRRPCAFDERLLTARSIDNHTDVIMAGSEDDLTFICTVAKRKCSRHLGWQKLRSAALDMEKANIMDELRQVAGRLKTATL